MAKIQSLASVVLLVLMASGCALMVPKKVTLRFLDRAVASAMTRDDLADLPDGIHVMLCGAGSPLVDIRRSGPCVAVQAGDHLYIVDAGTNGARNLGRFFVDVGRVEAVFLTHAHSDHIDGLGELGMLRWLNSGAQRPLPVHGPPVVEGIVAGFNQAYAADIGYRVAHQSRPRAAARTIQIRNTAPPAKLVCGHGSGSHAPKFIGATHAPTSVWVRAGDHSLARLLRKLSSRPAFTASATPGRNPCLRAVLGGA